MRQAGYCECGCGETTNGKPFLRGHHQRPITPRWIEEDRGYETPCWIWQWGLTRHGYARWREFKREGHIITWERANGPVPDGLELDHLCRVPACVNPDHLEPVTHRENVRRGGRTILSEHQVREIRSSSTAASTLALRYGVARDTIYSVRQRKSWKDVA